MHILTRSPAVSLLGKITAPALTLAGLSILSTNAAANTKESEKPAPSYLPLSSFPVFNVKDYGKPKAMVKLRILLLSLPTSAPRTSPRRLPAGPPILRRHDCRQGTVPVDQPTRYEAPTAETEPLRPAAPARATVSRVGEAPSWTTEASPADSSPRPAPPPSGIRRPAGRADRRPHSGSAGHAAVHP